jgi:CRISPR/Cas system-associated exonuclease Cas4 (RecB family)
MAKRFSYYDPHTTQPFRISRSKVQLFLDCPRCFYLDVRLGIKRPPGFPFSLNSAVDALLKKEFDVHRENKTMHPYIKETGLNAIPYQHENLDLWRNNFKGVSCLHKKTNFETFGAIDDLWLNLDTNEVIVVDYKATSKNDEVTLDAEWQDGYKNQMEFYQWLLRNNGLKVANQGWFVYCNGRKDLDAFNNHLEFIVKMLPYEGDTSWIDETLDKIKRCLESNSTPLSSDACDYCKYVSEYKAVLD